MLRRGIVVDIHPEDYSVDLVMSDNGTRLTGVQVMTPTGSTRSGMVELPKPPERGDKWDITEETEQELLALVASCSGFPVVVGFIYPQINRMLPKDKEIKLGRHESDVTWMIDKDGNMQIAHPNGTYIRIGEDPELVEWEPLIFDDGAAIDRNTDKKPYVKIALPGGKGEIVMTPDGELEINMEQSISIVSNSGAVTVDSALPVKVAGNVMVSGIVYADDFIET